MYIVTGGAGFIGSNLVHELNFHGISDILIVDNFAHSRKRSWWHAHLQESPIGSFQMPLWMRSSDCLRVGRIDEWHLVIPNSFQEIALGFPPGFSEVAIVIRVPFFEPRFIPIRTIRDSMTSHRVK